RLIRVKHSLWLAASVGISCLTQNAMGAQQVSLSLSSGSASSGSTVTLSIAMESNGNAQPASLQWSMGYAPSDVDEVTVVPGPAALAAGKSVSCSSGGGKCIVFGLNDQVIGSGSIGSVTFRIAARSVAAVIPVTLTGP